MFYSPLVPRSLKLALSGRRPPVYDRWKLCSRFKYQVVKYGSQETCFPPDLNSLAEKVERISLKSDAYGYDILSFNGDKSERYIEVKATRAKPGTANFFLTFNELKTANEKQDNYYIYMVYDILSTNPKIWIISNPFSPKNENVIMEPVNYRVKINAKKTNIS